MSWALINPQDGEQPRGRALADGEQPKAGEVVVEEVPPGWVWDASSGSLRPRTEGEVLEAEKASKVDDFARRAIDDLAPLFTPGAGRDETMLLVASHVLKICEALNVPADPRLAEVVSTGEKALAKKAEVEAAESVEELEGIGWEEPA